MVVPRAVLSGGRVGLCGDDQGFRGSLGLGGGVRGGMMSVWGLRG